MVKLDGFLVCECNWGVEGEVWKFLIWVVVVVSGLIGGREEGGGFGGRVVIFEEWLGCRDDSGDGSRFRKDWG